MATDIRGAGPIGIGLGVAGFLVAGAILINGCAQRTFAAREAEITLILKAISTDPVQAGRNLNFLVKAEVIGSKKQRDKLAAVLQNTRSGAGPALGAPDDNSRCPMPVDARKSLEPGWLTIACEYWWPPYQGFDGPQKDRELAIDEKVDRFGGPHGTFLSPTDATYDQRAIPYEQSMTRRYTYKVLKPFKVKEGLIAPWFDKPGGGTQYKTSKPISDLIAEKFLEEVK